MSFLYPLKLSYVTKSPLWGGRRLLDTWGLKAANDTIGEAWTGCSTPRWPHTLAWHALLWV